jgi:hypothetical protein
MELPVKKLWLGCDPATLKVEFPVPSDDHAARVVPLVDMPI